MTATLLCSLPLLFEHVIMKARGLPFLCARKEPPSVQRRRRVILEGLVLTAAVGWLTAELARPEGSGFTPPASTSVWSWSDLVVRSSPSFGAHAVDRFETGERLHVIRRPDGWAAVVDSASSVILGSR